MKVAAITTLLAALVGSAVAAPAIVWKSETGSSPVHSSDLTDVSSLVASALESSNESSLASVVFVVGRDENGEEGLTNLAQSGDLPNIASKYHSAHTIHSHVQGVVNSHSVARDARDAVESDNRILEVSLSEFNSKIASFENTEIADPVAVAPNSSMSKVQKAAKKRARELSAADVLVVNVSGKARTSKLDSVVSSAIENSEIGSVVLTAVRSVDEVKLERNLLSKKKMAMNKPKPSNRRRLEDRDWEDEEEDQEGIYYVNMTPNIFSGILFFFFFVFVTYTGIGCMDMITGQEVYVSKFPTVGREA